MGTETDERVAGVRDDRATTSAARLDDVRLTYDDGRTWALDGVTLDVHEGERLCVLGANGSGKSTLASVLCGLLAPDEGTVSLAGRPVFTNGRPNPDAYRHARHHIGLVFQNPEDQIVTTVVADDVAFGPENLGVPRVEICRRVDRELERVAMSPFAQADPTHLSGGQQQRIAIAGALAMEPDMLVLDEPGALLDVRGRAGIMHVMGRLQTSGTTIVHITHFVDEALEADRMVVLDHGRIALEGTPSEVFSHAEVLDLLGLELPFAARLSQALRRRGVDIPTTCDSDVLLGNLSRDDKRTGLATQAVTPGSSASPFRAAADTGDPILELDHVSFSYAHVPALDDVTLSVRSGELVALVGQTGSGKTTLTRLACALAMPDAGTVRVDGIDTRDRRHRRDLRGHVGYVMQHPERQLFAPTVGADVAFGPTNLGLPADEVDRRVADALDVLGIADKASSSPFDLSGGQQRLAAIAGVLAMDPSVLVLDEPTSGLDPRGAARLRSLVATLHETGGTVLLVSHSMDDVAALADRVVVLDGGHIALEGTPAEVFSHADELATCGLGVPSALSWAERIRSAGIPLEGDPLTLDSLADSLAMSPLGEGEPWRSR